MGKARILSAQGDGLYTIEILEDRARAESLRAMAQQRIAEIDAELADLEQELDDAQQAVDAAAEAQDDAIEQHRAEILATGESSVDLQAPAQAVLDAAAARDAIRTRIGSLNLERLSRQGWVDRVDALPPLRTRDAWCADYTEDLDGEVATAEVPGEVGQVIIKPGFEGNAWTAADGAMQPALASTPAGVFYNLAMMPGWQKWRPTFRIGTISNISNDMCDVTLAPAASSQLGLNVNAQASYSGVPIYYMDCNSAAFEDGDRVLVAFSGNTGSPMIVGFEREPRRCGSCEPAVLGVSPSSGTWNVSSLYGSMAVEATLEDAWRIVHVESGEAIHSGGLRESGGRLYMDGLPESLSARLTERVVDGPSHCNPPDDILMDLTFPSPDPAFWGGRWGSSYLDGGVISDTGQIITSWGEVISSWLVIWTQDDCFNLEVTYTSPVRNYEIQLGCKRQDGSMEWP